MGKNNNVTKLAFIGNTKLTKHAIEEVLKIKNYKIVILFGLSDAKMIDKVNSISMDSLCKEAGITLDKSEDWDKFYYACKQENVDTIITLGDSRVVPKKIVNNFEVIGNHGAILPHVKGGASLVWGRMFNLGFWGISIMKIREKIDSGEILKTKKFHYTDVITEKDFVQTADALTIEALLEVLGGDVQPVCNKKWDVRVSKQTDSYKTSEIFKYCMDNDLCIYLPPRTPKDGTIKQEWPQEFINNFKIANNNPYPKWINEKEGK